MVVVFSLVFAGCLGKQSIRTITPVPTEVLTETPLVVVTSVPTIGVTASPEPTVTPKAALKALSSCKKLDEDGGRFFLTGNLQAYANCIEITAESVELNCRNYSVKSVSKNNTGIVLKGANGSIIKNCEVDGFADSIVVVNTHNAKLSANSFTGNHNGIKLSFSSNNNLSENNFTRLSSGYGVILQNSDYNNVYKNNFNYTQIGILVNVSNGNTFKENVAFDNTFSNLWILNSDDSFVEKNDFSTNKKLLSQRAGIINEKSQTTFKNNTVCTTAPFEFQCIGGNARDLGGNTCTKKADNCNVSCAPC
ncbi:MAG: right-handed parallel beta-helix repeat-containing protein [Candidatus Micrarchaeia archaeon]